MATELTEKRVALVIGNSTYRHAATLSNPVNDAKAIGGALTRLGFTGAEPRFNLDNMNLGRALQEFGVEADDANMAVIYFAGHGIEIDGRNFLIPVDAKLVRSRDADVETVSLDYVLSSVKGARQLQLIILDACRNNPFRSQILRSGRTRSVSRGLRSIEPEGNVLVAYAAKHGTVAIDGENGHSPFAEALLRHLEKPGIEIGQLFREVRDDVLERTGREQEPHLYGSLGREMIYLKAPETGNPLPQSPVQSSGTVPSEGWVREGENPPLVHERLNDSRNKGIRSRRKFLWTGVLAITLIVTTVTVAIILFPTAQNFSFKPEVAFPNLKPAFSPIAEKKPNGGLTAVLEQAKCDGVKVSLAEGGAECIQPASHKSFRDCLDCPEMVVVPAGGFMMGSTPSEIEALTEKYGDHFKNEGPQHKVEIAEPFAVGQFEVTFAEWDACVSAGGCEHKPDDQGWGRGDRPVINVSWEDITKEYLPWLSKKTGKAYHLPSESEWEYATRAGSVGPFSFDGRITMEKANFRGQYSYDGNTNGEYRQKTVPVKNFTPNPWGLYQVHGNVWEWVQDCYSDNYMNAPRDGSPAKETSGCMRVLRGGSWDYYSWVLRSAYRSRNSPRSRFNFYGFRVARSLSP